MLFQPRPPKSSQFTQNRHTYMPPGVQRAMEKRMQRGMPAPTKQLADPYVEQSIVAPQAPPQPPAPGPAGPAEPTAYTTPPTPGQPPLEAGVVAPSHEYDFITDSVKPPSKVSLPAIPGIGPTATRAGLVGGGLVVLFVLFSIIKGVVSGPSPLPLFVGIAQDQQALIHLATNASQQKNLTVNNQNFAATAQLSLTSAQASVIKYMAINGKKVDLKLVSQKVSASTDAQLTSAAAATTYDQTFRNIMQSKLTTYISDLQQTYQKTKGKKGHDLLNDNYNQAQLLLTQLNNSATAN